VVFALSLVAGHALGRDDEERAKTLFFEGHTAADQGDHETACTKFAESLALFRRASTLLNLGECSEKLGRLADALRYWRQGAALVESNDARLELAKQRVAELDLRVPRLRVALPPQLPSQAVITLDGAVVTVEQLTDELRLDAGPHALGLTAPECRPTEVPVELAEGADQSVSLYLGEPLVTRPGQTPSGAPAEDHTQRTVAFVMGAVGVAGLVVGAVTGGLALDRKGTVEDYCQDDLCTNQAGVDAAASGRTLAIVSTVGFAAGGALLGTGVVLLLTSGGGEGEDGDATALRPTLSPTSVGLSARWRF